MFLFLPFLPGGRPFFFYHIRGKNGKDRNGCFFTVLIGGRLFQYHIRSKNGKKNKKKYRFFCAGAKGYPLAKQRWRTGLVFVSK